MIGLIMGPQGSGKGTQAERIEKEFGFKQLSTGDMMRAERAKDTERGRMIKELIDAGNLVPSDITSEMTHEEMIKYENVLLDGYPRSMDQTEYINKHFKVDFIILIDISEEETIKRLEKRRICTTTKKIFIADKITQADIDECTAAGGEIIQRDDDKPEAIKHRLNIYHEQTRPVVDFFEKKGTPVFRIKGEQSIDDVWKDIKEKLEGVLS